MENTSYSVGGESGLGHKFQLGLSIWNGYLLNNLGLIFTG